MHPKSRIRLRFWQSFIEFLELFLIRRFHLSEKGFIKG